MSEFGGGLSVALGLLRPFAAAAVIGAMLIATVLVLPKGFFGGFELPLLMLVAVGSVGIAGPGAISIDHLLELNFPEPLTFLVLLAIVLAAASTRLPPPRLQPPPVAPHAPRSHHRPTPPR